MLDEKTMLRILEGHEECYDLDILIEGYHPEWKKWLETKVKPALELFKHDVSRQRMLQIPLIEKILSNAPQQEDFDRESLEKAIRILDKNPYSQLDKLRGTSDPLSNMREKIYSFINKKLHEKFYSINTVYYLEDILEKKKKRLARLKEDIGNVELGELITKRKYKKLSKSLFSENIHPFFSELLGFRIKEDNIPKIKTDSYVGYNIKRLQNEFEKVSFRKKAERKGHKKEYIDKLCETLDFNQTGAYRELSERIITSDMTISERTYRWLKLSAVAKLPFINALVHEEIHRYQTLSPLLDDIPILSEGHSICGTDYFGDITDDKNQKYYTKSISYMLLIGVYEALCSFHNKKARKFSFEEFVDAEIKSDSLGKQALTYARYMGELFKFSGETEVDRKEDHEHEIGHAIISILVHKEGNKVLSQMLQRDYCALFDYILE